MKLDRTEMALSSLAALAFGLMPTVAQAQIVPDASLPVNSIVAPDGNVFTIDGGTQAGGNLFHSFQDFSLPTGTEAFFNNALDVQNIFSRVTGGNISHIDGLIRANGGASLFLLNPNGIVFGPNARLDIGGSFLGSTADNVVFQDGSVFSATEANAPPLLTINVPVGLQMGTNPGAIQVRGTSHELTPNSSVNLTQFDRSQSPRGLQVGTGNTVALIGDGVFFDGGILTAEAGHIEVGSVVRGRVTLNYADGGWRFGYDNAQELGNLQLVGRSALDASSPDNIGELSLLNGGGSIGLQGDRILLQNSLVLIQNQGTQPSGNIAIQASDTVEMRQETPGSPNSSGVVNLATGTGNGGGIAVSARRLTLQDRFAVFAMTSGTGAAGNIEIDTSEALELTRSRIQVRTFGAGNTGDIAVSTGQLKIQDTASITAASFSAGLGGNVTIDAESIDVVGSRPETGSISFIGVVTLGDGDAGNLTIDTSRLSVRGGGRINAAT